MPGKFVAPALAACLLPAAGALAQTADPARFAIGTEPFTMPMPQGYCMPNAAQEQNARYAASLDKDNVTLLNLSSCGERASPLDFVVLKTPVPLVNLAVTRHDLLTQIGPTFDSPDGKPFPLDATREQMEGELSDKAGSKVGIALELRPRGKDDVCAYLGGVIRFATSNGKDASMVMAGCITVVGNRAVMVALYYPGTDLAQLPQLLRRARAMALTISPAR